MTYQWHKLESSLMHVYTFYRIAKRNFRLIVFLVKYSAYKQIIKLFIKRRMSGKLRYIYYCIVWSAGNENDVARSVGTSLSIQSRENDITTDVGKTLQKNSSVRNFSFTSTEHFAQHHEATHLFENLIEWTSIKTLCSVMSLVLWARNGQFNLLQGIMKSKRKTSATYESRTKMWNHKT